MEKLEFLKQVTTQKGDSLWDLSCDKPILLVFLRHFGCVFCKEAMTDLSNLADQDKLKNVKLVLVHLSDPLTAETFFAKYKLKDVDYITDPDGLVYQQFGLLKATMKQLMGLKVWLRTFQAGVLEGHGLNSHLIGDGFQMPGVFLVHHGEIRESFVHTTVSDKPDYTKLAECIDC